MKTIFLDIDGVLNVDYADRDQFGHIFRDEYVQNLKEIIEKTGAKIVISSTWKDKGIERMLSLWKERNLPGEIIDVTPDCVDVCEATNIVYYDQVKRGHEIKLWLDRHPEVTQYVILDDIQDFLDEQQDYFVNCSTGEPQKPWKLGIPGLKEECKIKAINILNMKDKIEFAEFLDIQSKLEIKVGEIKTVSDVPKSDKLIKLEVDFGEESFRVVVTNIKPSLGDNYVDILTGKRLLFVTNLKPVKMMGIESTAMIIPGFYDDWAQRLTLSTIDSKPGLSIL
jgi:methionine--tRNA ligase beta chain